MRTPEIRVSPFAYLAAAAGILLLPLNILICAVTAAAVHELAHCVALSVCRVPIFEIRIGAMGARIRVGPMTPGQEMLCAAAGPLGSFALVLLSDRMPVLALFGFVQGLFNLIPVYPFDGGRIAGSLIRLLSGAQTIP